MSLVVFAGAMAGFGCVGMCWGMRPRQVSLFALYETVNGPYEAHRPVPEDVGQTGRAGRAVAAWLEQSPVLPGRHWAVLAPSLAITGESLDGLASKALILGGVGLLAPPILWTIARCMGATLPVEVALLVVLVTVPLGIAWPVLQVLNQAKARRRHVRVVLGSFVDLVVLSLAGGMGVEGALFAASQVSPDWAATRMARTLLRARDSGQSPWVALGQLGVEIGVTELVELSSTLQLAGTEGTRIRQSLSARAVSLRRHEQADAESSANAMTERLFVPGSLLMVGFLIFVGYPAFSRIIGGF